jgi:manganese/zinc-transporting P-type ATPase C
MEATASVTANIMPDGNNVPQHRLQLHYTIVHELSGRVRLRIEELKEDVELGQDLIEFISSKAGIFESRINNNCGSLIVKFDPAVLSTTEIINALENNDLVFRAKVRLLAGNAANCQTTQITQTTQPSLPGFLKKIEQYLTAPVQVVLGASALAAALLEAPVLLTAPLLAAAITPMAGRAAKTALQEKRVGIDLLDSLAAVGMLARGNIVSAAFMTALISGGEFIREQTSNKCKTIMGNLLGLAGRSAWVVRGKRRVCISADEVREGDIVVVYAGEMVPVDGEVVSGSGEIDSASLTGESLPVDIDAGAKIFASNILLQGKLYVRCTASGNNTRASHVLDLVNSAPLHQTCTENYASKAADKMVMPVLAGSTACFILTGDLTRALSFLIFDFATGIRIAAPTAVLASMQRAAGRGILIKNGAALERLAAINAIVFDKTGTLTSGEPQVTEVFELNGVPKDTIIGLAASAEVRLHHPAARAIVRYAVRNNITIPERSDSEQLRGYGVKASVGAYTVTVGSPRMLEMQGINTVGISDLHERVACAGQSLACVAINNQLAGVISYKDTLRPEAVKVIKKLRRRGIKQIIMATGDIASAAHSAAREIGITNVVSGAYPEHKAELVKDLKSQGYTVAVVGDGINDSPAFAYADIAIALHGGTEAAREHADVILTDDDLGRLPEAFDIAKGGMDLVHDSINLAIIPNGAGMALAATGVIGPAVATLLNNGSAILSALNSLRPLYSDVLTRPGRDIPRDLQQ